VKVKKLKKLKSKDLLSLSEEEFNKRLLEIRSEYFRLKSMAARGALKKETGMIKSVRRNIARLETIKRLRTLRSTIEVKKEA
jgi:large subunit ribosomal protein L29